MIEILKASAGSGKTFNLAKNYIFLLLRNRSDREAFRHILAVTFTNKATEEMKSRILKDLHQLSTNPSESPLAPFFLPGADCMSPEDPVCPDLETLQKASGDCLAAILHDYGDFSVSTIDRFFQRALKAFSREAGHFTAYQVELDRNALIEKSVAQLLDGLAPEDETLLNYLRQGAVDALENGRKINLLKQLTAAASRLFGEEYRDAAKGQTVSEQEAFDPREITRLMQYSRGVERDFVKRVRELADQYLSLVEAAGLTPQDCSAFFTTLSNKYRFLRPGDKLERPGTRLAEGIANPQKWFPKSDKSGPSKLARLPQAEMVRLGEAFLALFGEPYTEFKTAAAVNASVWNLGVAARLKQSYESLTREKNLLTLEDSNTLLHDVIDGSDAPFVYERLGVRYEHFLLDEFQDTSRVQWDNMLPLLLESQSHEGRSGEAPYGLIVGDIKQSIYRWRGSDWKLMQEQAPGVLTRAGVAVWEHPLKENYRSLERIIAFNNGFFAHLARRFDEALGRADRPIGQIYEEDSLYQKLPEQKAGGPGGCVDIEFLPAEEVFARVLEVIGRWRGEGVPLGDIAILVRVNSHGSQVAEYLMGHDPTVRIVSDDSLRIRSSEVVRRLVAALYVVLGKDVAINGFIAGESDDPSQPAPGRSLMDLCQQLLRREDPELLRAHTLFVDAFLDLVQEYVECNGNDLAGFLEAFESSDRSIASPEGSDAVRIITVHKSKGLQFPYVIYLNIHTSNELNFRQGDRKWCLLDSEAPALAPLSGRVYDIDFHARHDEDLFCGAWTEEKCFKHIDVINTYYVAFTRAKNGLCILSDGKGDGKNVAGELYRFADAPGSGFTRSDADGGRIRFRLGEPYYGVSEKKRGAEPMPMAFVSYPPGERLAFSPEAGDFFGEEGLVGVDASARRRGTAYHRILSAVQRAGDLESAVESERLLGNLDSAQAAEALDHLRGAVAEGARMGLFPEGEGVRILNEVPLMDARGEVLRPDRVVIEGNRVRVVDYKFGEAHPAYARQLKRYVEAFRAMGYPQVEGWLWYVEKNEFVPETK